MSKRNQIRKRLRARSLYYQFRRRDRVAPTSLLDLPKLFRELHGMLHRQRAIAVTRQGSLGLGCSIK